MPVQDLPGYKEGLNFPAANISTVMSTKARVPEESGNPVAATSTKNRSLTGRDEGTHLSPIQRMQGRIQIADPELVRRIIFDPSLEP